MLIFLLFIILAIDNVNCYITPISRSNNIPLKLFSNHFNELKSMKSTVFISLFTYFTIFNINPAYSLDLKQYNNNKYHTKLSYPADWIELIGQLSGDREIEAFTDPNYKDTSLSIVYTPIPADYSKLNSFGGKETIRQYVLPSGEGVSTNVINEKIKGEAYILEYTITAPDIPERHIISVFALRPKETIIALTIQSNENDYANIKEKFNSILPTFEYDISTE